MKGRFTVEELTRREELIMMLECLRDSIGSIDGVDKGSFSNTILSGVRPSSAEFVFNQTIKYLEGGDE